MGVHEENGQFSMAEAKAWEEESGSNINRFWHKILHRPDAHAHDTEFVQKLGNQIEPGDAAVFHKHANILLT